MNNLPNSVKGTALEQIWDDLKPRDREIIEIMDKQSPNTTVNQVVADVQAQVPDFQPVNLEEWEAQTDKEFTRMGLTT